MDDEYHIGRIVLIHDPKLAASVGRSGEAAVVLQRRRGSARIGFLSDGGNAWVEDQRLYALDAAPEVGTLLGVVSTALQCLQVEDVALESVTPQVVELQARCLALEEAELEELRERLGGGLASWSVVPYGMAAIVVGLELKTP
jgi:hypothetical protein